jgi:hypothetical protein
MRLAAAILSVVIALTGACARKPPAQPAGGPLSSRQSTGEPPSGPASQQNPDPAVRMYGYGPQPNAHVTYQPDVIIIGGGPRAIRGVASGLRWIIDANAPGARELRPGKVMFATSRAIGRVIDLEQHGSDLTVRLAPVGLTEVLRDAQIDLDRQIPFDSLTMHMMEDLAPASASRRDLDGGSLSPAVWYPDAEPARAMFVDAQRGGTATGKFAGKISIGNWELEPYLKKTEKYKQSTPNSSITTADDRTTTLQLGVKAQWTARAAGGLKLGADLNIYGSSFHVRTHISAINGKLDPSTFVIDGIEGLSIGLAGGAENGAADNVKARLELPLEYAEDLPPELTGGVPMVLHLKQKLLIETAFSGRNTTLVARGDYGLQGPIGLDKGVVYKPTLVVKEPMLQSIRGVTVGPSGIVAAMEVRILLGFGESLAMAGPYAKLVAAVGVSRGSVLGISLADCRSVTLKVDAGLGVGAVLDSRVAKLLDALKVRKTEVELAESLITVYNLTKTVPDVPLCRG